MSDKPFVLVDGSSYMFRAFHALPPMHNPDGQPTHAVYGVINMLKRLVQQVGPSHMAVVFDAKGKTFRDDLYPEYKANRPPMPDDLRVQIEPLHAIVEALGMPMIVHPGVEADDVLGTLAVQAAQAGQAVLMSTGDKDMAQLVNDKVTLVNTMSNTTLDPDGVVEKFGVRPDQIIDYLALMGDSVDNIPGVKKCGPKTAVKWLSAYGSLDGVIAHADDIKGKVGEYLREAIPSLPLSYQLATIKTDVVLDKPWDQLQLADPNRDELIELFGRMNFRTWLRELNDGSSAMPDTGAPTGLNTSGKPSSGKSFSSKTTAAAPVGSAIDIPPPPSELDYQTITDKAALAQWLERLDGAEIVAFDTETTSLDYMQADIVGVSAAVTAGQAMYIPLAHTHPDGSALDADAQLDRDWVLGQLRPWLENPAKAKVGQNLKYDMSVLARYGITLRGIAHDTMLLSYIWDSVASRHDMDSLAQKYLGLTTVKYEDIAGKGAKQIGFAEVPLEVAAHYAAEDADITLRLYEVLWPSVRGVESLRRLYEEVEMPLVPLLSEVERRGVLLDILQLQQQSTELAQRMDDIQREAHEAAGVEFNLSSPKQLGELLYDKLGLPVIRKTPKGAPSTAEDVLEQLAREHPVPRLVVEYRGMSKLRSTYTEKLPEQVDSVTGRVHTSYHQAVAATGRLSSSDPNLQNIPIRTPEGRRIRHAFVPPEGKVLVAADYSQIELRIMAHLSGDDGLLGAFSAGVDVHRHTAAEVFGVSSDAVDTDQRRAAKAINFGLIYGMSAFGLAKQLGVARREAQNYVDRYFQRYPGVREYMERTRESARELGYVETVFGRRLYLPDIAARNVAMRQYAERTAINAPMQGTAADIIKRAMIAVQAWLDTADFDAAMIMQVHDELVFEVDAQQHAAFAEALRPYMENAAQLRVPLIVETGFGDNWQAAH